MAQLENRFSWSRSRDECFTACPRQYFFEYYAFWDGWSADAPARTRLIYMLKQLKSRQMWVGGAVHDAIEHTFRNIRRGITPLGPEAIIQRTREDLRTAFRSSRAGHYRSRPKTPALYEHEYAVAVPDEEWRRVVENGLASLATFYQSAIYQELAALPRDAWLEVEEFSSFDLDGLRVWVKLDASHRLPEGGVRIIDWKTGRLSSEQDLVQLACYALYATRTWGVSPRDVRMLEYNLASDEVMSYAVSEESLADIAGYIHGSAADMARLLTDPERNTPLPEDAFAASGSERSCARCKYRKVCPKFA